MSNSRSIKQMWTPAKKYHSNSSFTRQRTTAPPATSPYQTPHHKPSSSPSHLPKPQQRIFLLPHLQDIYAQLNFNNNLPTFCPQSLSHSKHKLSSLLTQITSSDSRCLIHPTQTLNLFCQKDKSLLCILCVHRDTHHKDKSHPIVPVSSISHTLQLQTQKLKDRINNIIYKLSDWEHKLREKMSELGEICIRISNQTEEIFNSIREEVEMNQKAFAKTLAQNQMRANKVMELYYEKIEEMRNQYGGYLYETRELGEVDQLSLLKGVEEELGVAEELVRKAYEMMTVFPIWREIDGGLERLRKRYEGEAKQRVGRHILVTEF